MTATPSTSASNVTLPASALSFTIAALEQATCISRTKIYDDLKAGRLRARKHGKRTIIIADEARRWLESLPAQSSQQTVEARSC
jgi:hypothetical protein